MASRSGTLVLLGVLALGCSHRNGEPVTRAADHGREHDNGATEAAGGAQAPLAGRPGEQAPARAPDAAGADASVVAGADAAAMDAGADAAALDAGPQTQCAALQLLTLSEPTLAHGQQAMHEPWPQDGRLVIQYSGQAFKVGIRLTNASTAGMSKVGVSLTCPSHVRVHNGGTVWFESIASQATTVASVTVQSEPAELVCHWHTLMGVDPWLVDGCAVEARQLQLSIVLE